MDFDPMFGWVIFFGAYFAGRLINERALKHLSIEEKARLVDGFSGHRIYTLGGVVALFVLYAGVLYFFPEAAHAAFTIYLVVSLVLLCVLAVLTRRKLRRLEMPPPYIRTHLLGTAVQYVGIAVLLGPMLFALAGGE